MKTTTSKDPLGDEIKFWENKYESRLDFTLPVVIRFDGRSFHTFTKNFVRPFDTDLHKTFVETTKELMKETGAVYGYTQSDEITIVILCENDSELIFGGRIQKMVSCLASFASVKFNEILKTSNLIIDTQATFDCRVFNVPTLADACKAVIWRERDAAKNSVQSYARSFFSSKALHKKNDADMQQMIRDQGHTPWSSLSDNQKYGTAIQKKTVCIPLDMKEIESLPPKHNARLAPVGSTFERSELFEMKNVLLRKCLNPREVVFYGEEPKV